MLLHLVISVDGKCIENKNILRDFNIAQERVLASGLTPDFEHADELEVTILPIIVGGQATKTITGTPGAFLEQSLHFSLVSKRTKKGVCVLRYQKA